MGDEGIGVLALKHLEAAGFGTRAELVDGGTGGFHLLGYFLDYRRLILIDAASDGKPPGTVSRIKPRFAADFPQSLVAHDIGLKDLIESAVLLGALPKVDLITVSIGAIRPMTLELSPAVSAAFPAIQAAVDTCLG
jgi:hydrogenase maturation protease